MMAHYDDDALVALIDAHDDPHIAECAECRTALEEYRAVMSSLHEEAVWDFRVLSEEPNPQTIANLRGFVSAMHVEDEAAEPLVAELLAGPREEWMPRLLSNDKYRTAGVVRRLMEASDKAIDVMPPDALEISALATEIADKLDPEQYPSDTVLKLRGNAWRDRGYCLYQCSHFIEARNAVCCAAVHFMRGIVSEYDLARLGIVQAIADRALDDFRSAASVAQRSAETFARFEDLRRFTSSLIAQAQSTWKAGDTDLALSMLLDLLSLEGELDADTRQRLLGNITFMYRETGETEVALIYHQLAAFEAQPDSSDAVIDSLVQVNMAVLLGHSGNTFEAERRLVHLMDRFRELGMISEAIQIGLEIAELHLAQNRFTDVAKLCSSAIAFYEQAGIPTTGRALTALAYLREGIAAERLGIPQLREVRRYLCRLRTQPALLFVPPPQ